MSRKVIAELEKDLDKVLVRYETEYEITTAEMAGVLETLKTIRLVKAALPFMAGDLKEVLEEPVLSQAGAPEGEFLHLDVPDADED